MHAGKPSASVYICRLFRFLCIFLLTSSTVKHRVSGSSAMDLFDFSALSTSDDIDPFTGSDIVARQQRQAYIDGYARGTTSGDSHGWHDGYRTGLQQGATVSAEIGYYEGFARTWIALAERESTQSSPFVTRKATALKSFLDLCIEFPSEIAAIKQNDDVNAKLAQIRTKFRQVSALIYGPGASVNCTSSTIARFSSASWNISSDGNSQKNTNQPNLIDWDF